MTTSLGCLWYPAQGNGRLPSRRVHRSSCLRGSSTFLTKPHCLPANPCRLSGANLITPDSNRAQIRILGCNASVDSEGSEGLSEGNDQDEQAGKSLNLGRIARRTLLVSFTCDRCNTRTERLVNPVAWEKGMVFAQCSGCEVWHKFKDNMKLIDEIRYVDEE